MGVESWVKCRRSLAFLSWPLYLQNTNEKRGKKPRRLRRLEFCVLYFQSGHFQIVLIFRLLWHRSPRKTREMLS